MNITPSSEQQQILDEISNKTNIAVNSVAGSGKTTTALLIAKKYSDKNILLLTYNAQLKLDTRKRAVSDGITNLEIHTYHSFCVKHLYKGAFTDIGILKIFKDGMKFKTTPNYELIIVDEVQDMTPLFYKLLKFILHSNDCQLILVGDEKQCIYRFNNADERFLTLSHQIFEGNWKSLNLHTSYRVTDKMVDFYNNCVVGISKVKAIKKSNVRVDYVYTSAYNDKKYNILNRILYYLETYAPEDIMVLACSVRVQPNSNTNPVRHLSNLISKKGIPIFVPSNDKEEVLEKVIAGKMKFLSFHQAKGLEAKVCIIFNFDMSYFIYYNKGKEINRDICTNEIYVAITRAKEQLCLVHNNTMEHLPFVVKAKLYKYCNIIGNMDIIKVVNENYVNNTVSVTNLIRHLPTDVVEALSECFEYEIIGEKDTLDIATISKQGELFEQISEINGTAIPALFEYSVKKKMTIHTVMKHKQEIEEMTTPDLLELANKYLADNSGYKFKVNQIKNYNWIDSNLISQSEILQECNKRLSTILNKPYGFEYNLAIHYKTKMIIGFIDCMNAHDIWEIKCVNEVSSEHFYQAILYAELFAKFQKTIKNKEDELSKKICSFKFLPKLFNVKTNLQYNITMKKKILPIIFENYIKKAQVCNDDTFIKIKDNVKFE